MNEIIECIPNISEGKDLTKVNLLAAEVESVAGVKLLHVDRGVDANRTVFTFAGAPAAVFQAAYQLFSKSIALLDIRVQEGAHPRIGMVDVCPFVPLQGIGIDDLMELHKAFAHRVAKDFGIPIFLYEFSQFDQARSRLEVIRKGGYERLQTRIDAGFMPDLGPLKLHPKAGAMVTGVRNILVAFNFSIGTDKVEVAQQIAKQIRASGYVHKGKRVEGVFKALKSIGWSMPSLECMQVSCNFIDLDQTSVHEVHEYILGVLDQMNIPYLGAELIGLIPKRCFLEAASFYGYSGSESEKTDQVAAFWNLSYHKPFDKQKKVIENLLDI